MKKLLALLIACLALTVTACGDDDDDGGGSSTGSTPTTEQTKTDPAEDKMGGGAESVSIVDNDYEPKDVTVAAGTTVTWTNDGDAPHTVTAEGDFDSGTIDPGGTFEQKLETAGEIKYVCTIHPGQEGSITVE